MAQITFKDFYSIFGINIWKAKTDVGLKKYLLENHINNYIRYMGNKCSRILVIVEDENLYHNNDFQTLFIKMLKSIGLSLDDVFVLTYFGAQKHTENTKKLFDDFIRIFQPKSILILGVDIAKIINDDVIQSITTKTFGLADLINNPQYKKSAYHDLLAFKDKAQ